MIGCAVNTHTDPNDYAVTNPAMEQLDLLEDKGADLTKVIIGHTFIQNTGMHQLYEICDRGATVNVDHIGIPWKHGSIDELDAILAEGVFDLVERGYTDRIHLLLRPLVLQPPCHGDRSRPGVPQRPRTPGATCSTPSCPTFRRWASTKRSSGRYSLTTHAGSSPFDG